MADSQSQLEPEVPAQVGHDLRDFHEDLNFDTITSDYFKTYVSTPQHDIDIDTLHIAQSGDEETAEQRAQKSWNGPLGLQSQAPRQIARPADDGAHISAGFKWATPPRKGTILSKSGQHAPENNAEASQFSQKPNQNSRPKVSSKVRVSTPRHPASKTVQSNLDQFVDRFKESEASVAAHKNQSPNSSSADRRRLTEMEVDGNLSPSISPSISQKDNIDPDQLKDQRVNGSNTRGSIVSLRFRGAVPSKTSETLPEHQCQSTSNSHDTFRSATTVKKGSSLASKPLGGFVGENPSPARDGVVSTARPSHRKKGNSILDTSYPGETPDPHAAACKVETHSKREDHRKEPSQEDVLNVLLYTMQKEKEARDTERGKLEIQTKRLIGMTKSYEATRKKLEEIQKRDATQQGELKKYKNAVPLLQGKLEDLKNKLNILIHENDEMKHQAQAQKIALCQLQTERDTMIQDLNVTVDTVGCFQAKSREALEKLYDQTRYIVEDSQRYESIVNDNTAILDQQRERSDYLENELSTIFKKQEDAGKTVTEHMVLIMTKLEQLSDIQGSDNSEGVEESLKSIASMISICVSLLEEVRATPVTHQKSLDGIKDIIYQPLMKLNEVTNRHAEDTHQQLVEARSFQEALSHHLEELSSKISTEQEYRKQIEALNLTNSELKEDRHSKVVQLEVINARLLETERRKLQLEASQSAYREEIRSLRTVPAQDPSVMARIAELETSRRELQEEKSRLHDTIDRQNTTIVSLERAQNESKVQFDDTQSRLNETQAKCVQLEAEKEGLDAYLVLELEGERKNLVQAAKAEQASLWARYRGAKHEVREKLSIAETKIKDLEEQIKAKDAAYEQRGAELETSEKQVSESRSEVQKQVELVRAHIQAAQVQGEDRREQEQLSAKEIKSLNKIISTKDSELLSMKRSLEKINAEVNRRDEELLFALKSHLRELDAETTFLTTSEVLDALLSQITTMSGNSVITQRLNKVLNCSNEALSPDLNYINDDSLPNADNSMLETSEQDQFEGQSCDNVTAGQRVTTKDIMSGNAQSLLVGNSKHPGSNRNTKDWINGVDKSRGPFMFKKTQTTQKNLTRGRGTHVANTSAPANFSNDDRDDLGKSVQHATGLDMIDEITSPVGETQSLFPSTPVPGPDTPGSNDDNRENIHPRKSHTKTNLAAYGETPSRVLQPIDANSIISNFITETPLAAKCQAKTFSDANGKDAEEQLTQYARKLGNCNRLSKFQKEAIIPDSQGSSSENQIVHSEPALLPRTLQDGELKRRSVGSDPSNTSKTRKRKAETNDLGPTIGNSKSPGMGSSSRVAGQSRKSTRRRSQDKFQRRFQADGE